MITHTHPHTHTHSLECLQWLVESASGNPYTTAVDGMAPIHAAAQAGQVACIQWLVERAGVSPRHKADDGATPAHFAAAGGQASGILNKPFNWKAGSEKKRIMDFC